MERVESGTGQPASYPGSLELLPAARDSVDRATIRTGWRERLHIGNITLFITSLYLFILAITLMKDGSSGLAYPLQRYLAMDSVTNCLGLGWIFSYLIMSGSPVAAAAVTFFDAGVVDKMGAFAMIMGSRLGGSFVVLFIGFLYVLRGRDRATSLGMGALSLTVTATTYFPGLLLGMTILSAGWLDHVQFERGAILCSVMDVIVEPVALLAVRSLPEWGVFITGVGVMLLSFNLFDRCLPQMTLKESQLGRMSRLIYRPGIMLLLGAVVTLVSMSVSLSLSILVPLSSRGFVRRENVIPYIMGANITTFIDTLLAAVLLNNSGSFTIVLVAMVSIMLISILLLALGFNTYQHAMLRLIDWATKSNRQLFVFMVLVFLLPLLMVVL